MDHMVSKPMGHMEFSAGGAITLLDASSGFVMRVYSGVVLIDTNDEALANSHGWASRLVDTTDDEITVGMLRVAR